MIYKPFQDVLLSRLGMGNMRLPTVSEHGPIDTEKAQAIIDFAYSSGINYYDTAYMYHDGASETFLGEALKKRPRDSYYLADKFPGFMMGPDQTPADIFEEQLRRCQTDYFDFYLLHNMSERSIDLYLNPDILAYLLEQKQAGRIHHLGFSSHAKPETLRRFLDSAPCSFEFCQIELNYLDWTMQDAKGQYELLTERGIPVWVMEPVRGGKLASLTPAANAMLEDAQPGRSIASWAFRWLMRLPGVQLVLSGMTEMEQIVDNIATFQREDPLTDAQADTLMEACDLFRSQVTVPCTGCRYCTTDCPQGIDIPAVMDIYNTYAIVKSPMELSALNDLDKRPPDCIACGSCAKKCPQNIPIPEIMAKLTREIQKLPKVPGPPKKP